MDQHRDKPKPLALVTGATSGIGKAITAELVRLGHYEGRGWRGFHHHISLCIAAYGFVISETETIPPSARRRPVSGQKPAFPTGYRPTGAPDPAPASLA